MIRKSSGPAVAQRHVGQLGDGGALAYAAVLAHRRRPGGGVSVQRADGRLDLGVVADRQRQRDLHPGAAGVGDEPLGGKRRVAADDQGLAGGPVGQPQQRLLEHVDVVLDAVGAGVARPQQQPQRLAAPVAAVQERQDRLEPVPALVGARGLLLVGVRGHQRGVQVQVRRHRGVVPVRRGGAHPPQPLAGGRERVEQAGQRQLVGRDGLQRAPRRRLRRGPAEQGLLAAAQRLDVADRRAAVGQHHRQVTQHHPRRVAVPRAHPVQRPPQRAGQPEAVRRQAQQPGPAVALQPPPVDAHHEPAATAATLHPQGEPPELGTALQQRPSSQVRGFFLWNRRRRSRLSGE